MTYWENCCQKKCTSGAIKILSMKMGKGYIRLGETNPLISLLQNNKPVIILIDDNFLHEMEAVAIQD